MKQDKIIDSGEIKQLLENVNSWISNCDTKTSIILGILGVMLSLILSFDYINMIYIIIKQLNHTLTFLSIITLLCLFISIILLIIGISFLIRALIAKTNTKGLRKDGIIDDSLLFFSSISKNASVSEYKQKLVSCTENSWIDDLVSQVYICSMICEMKFQKYRKGLIYSSIGIGLLLISICLGYYAISNL